MLQGKSLYWDLIPREGDIPPTAAPSKPSHLIDGREASHRIGETLPKVTSQRYRPIENLRFNHKIVKSFLTMSFRLTSRA